MRLTAFTDMFILRTPAEMHAWSRSAHASGKTIGFVPTMGALHAGHAQLISQSANENNLTVVSIFVNPSQFNVAEDFDKYPRTFDADVEIAQNHGATAIYAPSAESMYPPAYRTYVEPGASADPMEGEGRPGHFRGVATVVVKLIHAVQPHRAYFGQKDFQQLAVVTETIRSLDMDVVVIGAPTVREPDGLALSSRNVRLTPEAREQAPVIAQALAKTLQKFQTGERSASALEAVARQVLESASRGNIEYVTVCDRNTLIRSDRASEASVLCIAYWFDDIRLIDNILLP